jgi:hypothetical protein
MGNTTPTLSKSPEVEDEPIHRHLSSVIRDENSIFTSFDDVDSYDEEENVSMILIHKEKQKERKLEFAQKFDRHDIALKELNSYHDCKEKCLPSNIEFRVFIISTRHITTGSICNRTEQRANSLYLTLWCPTCRKDFLMRFILYGNAQLGHNNLTNVDKFLGQWFDPFIPYNPILLPYGTLTGFTRLHKKFSCDGDFLEMCYCLPVLPTELVTIIYTATCYQNVRIECSKQVYYTKLWFEDGYRCSLTTDAL